MTADQGAPPKSGWAKLIPELLASDLAESLGFWRDLLGFAIAYQRPEEAFVYLERPEGAQIMLSQRLREMGDGTARPALRARRDVPGVRR
jgi:hypothetical protein